MAVCSVTYRYHGDPGLLARLRPERMGFFRRLEAEGVLLASGMLVGDGAPDGMLVLRAADPAAAAALLADDPFEREGMVAERTIAEWHVTVGLWTHD